MSPLVVALACGVSWALGAAFGYQACLDILVAGWRKCPDDLRKLYDLFRMDREVRK